jgi:hypothetical protein
MVSKEQLSKTALLLYAYVQMETVQNQTKTQTQIDSSLTAVAESEEAKLLKLRQQQYIDYCAVGGMITDEGGEVKIIKATAFAAMLGVARQTLYDWQKRIPDFWERVAIRRKELGGNNRIQKVWNGVYLKAAAGDAKCAALWLANFDPDFKMPTQRAELDTGQGLADLLQIMRQRQNRERKVIDVGDTEANHA